MSNQKKYKQDPIIGCFVPLCNNKVILNPEKYFFPIPEKTKDEWCSVAHKKNVPKGRLYICEDHLNLEEDLLNYEKWKTNNFRGRLKPFVSSLRNVSPKPTSEPDQEGSELCEQQNPNDANLEGIHSMPLEKERINEDVEYESIAADNQHGISVQQPAGHACGESTWAREQERSQNLPEARQIIANVYHYLQIEYEALKSSIGDSCDLSPLANIRSRTAAATGVSEETVSEALKTRKRSKDSKRRIKRPKLDTYFDDSDVSPIEEKSSDESSDEDHLIIHEDHPPMHEDHPLKHEEHHADEGGVGGQVQQDEPEVYTLKVEVDDEEETQYDALLERIRMDAVDPLSLGTSSELKQEVKPEPIEEKDPQMDTYLHFNAPPPVPRADVATPADGGRPLVMPPVSKEACEATRDDVTREPPGN